jgi:hypothetical protein
MAGSRASRFLVCGLGIAITSLLLTSTAVAKWRSPSIKQAKHAMRRELHGQFQGARARDLHCWRHRFWDVCRATQAFSYVIDAQSFVGSVVSTERVHWGYQRQEILVTPIRWKLIWPNL